MNRKLKVNKNLVPIHRTGARVKEHLQRPNRKRKGRECDVELIEVTQGNDTLTDDDTVRVPALEKHLKKLCSLFCDHYVVIISTRIYILIAPSEKLNTQLQEKYDQESRDLNAIYELLTRQDAFVITTDLKTSHVRIIRKVLENKFLFNLIEEEIKECIQTDLYRKIPISILNNTLEEGNLFIKRINKVISERQTSKKVAALSPVSGSKPFFEEKQYLCYPSGVQEESQQGRYELVLNSGTSIPVTHNRRGFVPILNPNQNGVYNRDLLHRFSPEVAYTRHQDPDYGREEVPRFTTEATRPRESKPTRYPEFSDYNKRLRTFARWTHQRPESTILSYAGFFFTDVDDLVRCFQCGIGLKDFSYSDNPLKEHVRHSTDCPFLLECLTASELSDLKSQILAEVQTDISRKYRRPELQTMQARLNTFTNWPGTLQQTPEILADAGMYYTGTDDCVRCFACDGGLQRWDPQDDPWIEHCRWFPQCPYAIEKKGNDFIALVQASAAALNNESSEAAIGGHQSTDLQHGLTEDINRLTLRDKELNKIVEEHRAACLDMGYSANDIDAAVEILIKRGTRPTIEDVLDTIQSKTTESPAKPINETPLEENRRLKNLVYCVKCRRNEANVLFLPCAHHRLCMACAKSLEQCNVCGGLIRQKIKTFMG